MNGGEGVEQAEADGQAEQARQHDLPRHERDGGKQADDESPAAEAVGPQREAAQAAQDEGGERLHACDENRVDEPPADGFLAEQVAEVVERRPAVAGEGAADEPNERPRRDGGEGEQHEVAGGVSQPSVTSSRPRPMALARPSVTRATTPTKHQPTAPA